MTARSLPAEIAAGTISAEAAAMVWLLIDAGVALNVTGPADTTPESLRSALVALSARREIEGATDDAESLSEVLRRGAPFAAAVQDASRGLGVVVVLALPGGRVRRVTAVHYVRPVERDQEGHLQRRPPAVLYAWDDTHDGFEDFGWGITPELAARAGMATDDFERQHAARAAFLAGLAAADVHDVASVERAVHGFRALGAASDHEPH